MSDRVLLHANAVNLARRYSVQNENDMLNALMQDDDMDEPMMPSSPKPKSYNHDNCSEMASHMISVSSLPTPCTKFADVVTDLKRRETDKAHPTQWMS